MGKVTTIDFETTDVYWKHWFDSKKIDNMMTPAGMEKMFEAWEYPTMLQVGVNDGKGPTRHINLKDIESQIPAFRQGDKNRIFVERTTMDDLKKYLTAKESALGMHPKKTEDYLENIGWKQIARQDKTAFIKDGYYISEWSDKKFMGIGAAETMQTLQADNRVIFSEQTLRRFTHGKGKDSMYGIMKDLLAGATKEEPALLQAWNPGFEISGITSVLYKGGHTAMLDEVAAKYHAGVFDIKRMEESWQKVAYSLVQENPEKFDKLTTSFNPTTAHALGNWGQKVDSWKKFQYSTMPWSQDFLSQKIFHKHPSIITATHTAGQDVNLSMDLMGANDNILNLAVQKAKAAGHVSVNSVEDIWKLGIDNTFVSEAWNEVAQRGVDQAKHLGGGVTSSEAVEKLSRVVNNMYEVNKREFIPSIKFAGGSGGGGGGGINVFGHSMPGGKGKLSTLSRYAGITLAMGALVAATYSNSRNEQKHNVTFNAAVKLASSGDIPTINAVDRSGETPGSQGPIIQNHPGRDLGLPLLGAAALITATGWGAAERTSAKLGLRYQKPTTAMGYAKELGKTFRYGMEHIESAIPLTRVFQVSNVIQTFFGTHNYNVDLKYVTDGAGIRKVDHSSIAGKMYKFNLIGNGKVIDARRQTLGSLDGLIDAMKIADPDNANTIESLLRPTSASNGVHRRVARLGSTGPGGSRTVLHVKDIASGILDHGSNVISEQVFELPMRISLPSIRRANIRDKASVHRFSNMGKESIVNPIAHASAKRSEISLGRHPLSTRSEYGSYVTKPTFVKKYPWMNAAYELVQDAKYHLRIFPKGAGEGVDYLNKNVTGSMIHKNANAVVHGLTGARSLDPINAKFVGKMAHDIAWAFTVNPIENFLEAPFELIGFDAHKLEAKAAKMSGSKNMIKSVFGRGLALMNRPGLGLGYSSMKYGIPEYMARVGLQRALPAFLGLALFDVADKALGQLATGDDETPGLLRGGAIWSYQQAQKGYSALSDMTGMTAWSKWQDEVAPGSSGMGILAPGASAVMTYSAGKFLYNRGPLAIKGFIDEAFDTERTYAAGKTRDWIRNNVAKNKWVQQALKGQGHTAGLAAAELSNGKKLFNWAIKNPKMGIFAAASLPMIPFLPGFLGSSLSYDERKAEFSGDKEVAIRKARGWLLSTSAYEGDKVVQYRQHASWLMSRDWEASGGVIWPSFIDKTLHTLSFGMYKPNILEEYHAKSQPTYRTSSSAENVPLIGGIIAFFTNQILGKDYNQVADKTIKGGGGPGVGSGGHIDSEAAGFASGGGQANYMSDTSYIATKWLEHTAEMSGFRGFAIKTAMQKFTGMKTPTEFTPYLETSSKLYNRSYGLWGYQAGDITGIGGEFLRRIYQNPQHEGWAVNDIPNELMGANWIPKNERYKDFTRGTTFDKTPMGWLYASRKGWEYLNPELKGRDLNDYEIEDQYEALQQIAPYSPGTGRVGRNVMKKALAGGLTPNDEQRFYDTVSQINDIKTQVFAHSNEYGTEVDTEAASGAIEYIDELMGKIKIEGYEEAFSIAGVSFAEADIRKRLLQQNSYNSSEQLSNDVMAVRERMADTLSARLKTGDNVDFTVASAANFGGGEAYIKGLSEDLWDAGAPFANTGALAANNMRQSKAGVGSRAMSRLWSSLTSDNTYFNKKFIGERDYISQYLGEEVFSKKIRLWTKPIDAILKPAIAQTLHRLGIDSIPDFTEERRAKQQYWDTMKYTKYKMLESQANRVGDKEAATKYRTLWRNTMVGANPMDANPRDEMMALPKNERAYFELISNEVDPERRGKLMKYLPEASKRIYQALWLKNMAKTSDNKELLEEYDRVRDAEGYNLTEGEEELYYSQTDGNVSKGDWARAQLVSNYAQNNPMPDMSWEGWAPNVDIENVQILSLQNEGEQTQDYGYFDNKVREAVYDHTAFGAATYLSTLSETQGVFYGTAIPALLSGGGSSVYLPSSAGNEISHITVETDGDDRIQRKSNERYLDQLDDKYV